MDEILEDPLETSDMMEVMRKKTEESLERIEFPSGDAPARTKSKAEKKRKKGETTAKRKKTQKRAVDETRVNKEN